MATLADGYSTVQVAGEHSGRPVRSPGSNTVPTKTSAAREYAAVARSAESKTLVASRERESVIDRGSAFALPGRHLSHARGSDSPYRRISTGAQRQLLTSIANERCIICEICTSLPRFCRRPD
jgi:hypothetical protein